MSDDLVTPIPTRWVGPLKLSGDVEGEQSVPLATYESPLWPSVGRGARISRLVDDGIRISVVDERMTRSSLFVAPSAAAAVAASRALSDRFDDLAAVVAAQSRHAKLIDLDTEIVGHLLFVRFALTTGDASGHNMVTLAAQSLMETILTWRPELEYGSISGNYCSDKKATAVNGILGRGRSVVAEMLIPSDLVDAQLRTSATRMVELNVRKNLVGSTVAGALRSANAHYANMLLAFYLATGQDAANIVEGSQGITYAEQRGEGDLLFSCTLPNLIVGTVGNGKDLPGVDQAIERLGCRDLEESGAGARRLAGLIAATVLCGELSLLAAQTNPGELMQSHVLMERRAGGRA
ncbi:hydroxymethylglutaryl-CoA reductase [Microbacterium aquimaris]|uniref:Hydroxymethylglutaryl-CoA reductase n=1 Tax=Microbacterium aquimaris TaxID=459816 RepID=A0ABU5N8L2_9MICO|nr:hydroxymethylglutaryl-CoA reductase [Microbacterium aquimaris]MDZ8162384.1 hydroxymethylglutaryl-CoA reductase [Microbacterium aquimaris]MDZ8276039.1 hydroxymethylglutaryl-CoA reductase [Microbacterium aquimaris]